MNIRETLKNYFQKIPAFLSGFMLGALLTGAFFIFKINEYITQFKELVSHNIVISETKNDSKINNDKKEIKPKKHKTKPIEKNVDSLENVENKDSLQNVLEETNHTSSSIVEEKIISEKEVKIIHLNPTSDTTFTSIADVPTHLPENSIKIVFKKTPFNNKGYYYENNYLVLVGLQDIPYINLYEYKGELYIKYDKIIFKLPYANSFQAFVKVNDEHIIAKMN